MPTSKPETYKLFVAAYDLHFPRVHWPTFRAMLSFMEDKRPDGFIFGGDQHDNEAISHHTEGKPLLRPPGAFKRETESFEWEILFPVEANLAKDAVKVWLIGNHDRWADDLDERSPQLQGMFNRPSVYKLDQRGWKVIPNGSDIEIGKLCYIHGDQLSGSMGYSSTFPAKKASEQYCSNILAGHTHAPQSYTKILPHRVKDKWMAHVAPALCDTDLGYLRKRPTAWLNGFVIIEYWGNQGYFNLYPVVVTNGTFAWGGRVYRG